MSDTSKAAPRPWLVGGCTGYGYDVRQKPPNWNASSEMVCGCAKEEDATLIVEAVNSYNPERDKLARELAEMTIEYTRQGYVTTDQLPAKARQLLKLYEEDGSPSTLPGG